MEEQILGDIARILVDLEIEEANSDILKELANVILDLELLHGGSR
ncbi:hypothetical protein [Desulfotomaculum sp. 1211_IL3151]